LETWGKKGGKRKGVAGLRGKKKTCLKLGREVMKSREKEKFLFKERQKSEKVGKK